MLLIIKKIGEKKRIKKYCKYLTTYIKTNDGMTIKYWDDDKNKPIIAGTLNFNIANKVVNYDGNIELNQMQ